MSSDWTKEDIEKVKAGLAQGHSARRIAMDLGNGRSRNAVIGIIHRQHLAPQTGDGLRRGRARAPRKPHGNTQASGKVARIQAAREKAKAKVTSAEPPVIVADDPALRGPAWAALPGTTPVPLLSLDKGMCKWPIGDERPFLFCGHAVEEREGAVYCSMHARRSVGLGTPSQRNAVQDAERAVRTEFRATAIAAAGTK